MVMIHKLMSVFHVFASQRWHFVEIFSDGQLSFFCLIAGVYERPSLSYTQESDVYVKVMNTT